LSGEQVTHVSEVAIDSRARLADALVSLMEADPRVQRWRRIEFGDDGGALVVVDMRPELGRIGAEVIARELEFWSTKALPNLPWVRVQVA
jgi:hypothetical protein